MGAIDLDPATNDEAQRTVRATWYYTADGELQPWRGRVFVNPPYDARIAKFADKLLAELGNGVEQAIFMSNSKTDTRWWQKLARKADAIAFVAGRIKSNGSKNSPTCGHTFMYFGGNAAGFIAEFSKYGLCVSGNKIAFDHHLPLVEHVQFGAI